MFCWHLSCVFFLWGTHFTILWSTRRNGSISACTYTFVHHIWPKMVTLIVFQISSCVIFILIIGFVCFNIMLFGPRRFTIVCFVVVQSLSRVQLCNPMDCSTPGFPVLHHLSEFAQTHVHWVSCPSHPLLSSSPAFNLSQHQGLFQWVSSSHHVAQVLVLQLQDQSFQWIFRTDFL